MVWCFDGIMSFAKQSDYMDFNSYIIMYVYLMHKSQHAIQTVENIICEHAKCIILIIRLTA